MKVGRYENGRFEKASYWVFDLATTHLGLDLFIPTAKRSDIDFYVVNLFSPTLKWIYYYQLKWISL